MLIWVFPPLSPLALFLQRDMKTSDELIAEQFRTDPECLAGWERTALARAVAVAIVRYRTEHDLSQRELAAPPHEAAAGRTLGARRGQSEHGP